jgi:hypothetical protein
VLRLRFYSESARHAGVAAAAVAYRYWWDADGGRVVACLEGLTGFRFGETTITPLLGDRASGSHPLLRADHDDATTGEAGSSTSSATAWCAGPAPGWPCRPTAPPASRKPTGS